MATEEPCESTGKPCVWACEEWENEDGAYTWDLYCDDCYRYRDWSKDELKAENGG